MMRRFLSIAVVLALLALPLSPAWAASMCAATSDKAQCHRMEMGSMATQHHCDAMGHKAMKHEGMAQDAMQSEAEDASDGPALTAGDSGKCPMNCCVQGSVQTGTLATTSNLLPQMISAGKEIHFAPVMFTSAGFSSHTDRGPPAAASLA